MFLDWLIWFSTADACTPHEFMAKRDAIKYDPTHLYSSSAARLELANARDRGERPGRVVEHEHAIPKRRLIALILGGTISAQTAFDRFARAAIVTKAEHAKLNRFFKDDMPPGWSPKNPEADPFARYRHPDVAIQVDEPHGAG